MQYERNMSKRETQYEERAEAFLTKHELTMRIVFDPTDTPPGWDEDGNKHGYKYNVTISRKGVSGRLTFEYWDCLRNREAIEQFRAQRVGKLGAFPHPRSFPREPVYSSLTATERKPPFHLYMLNPFSVLCTINSDAHGYGNTEDFESWCSDYGYDPDSRKALKTYKRCRKLAVQINRFFKPEELEELSHIEEGE